MNAEPDEPCWQLIPAPPSANPVITTPTPNEHRDPPIDNSRASPLRQANDAGTCCWVCGQPWPNSPASNSDGASYFRLLAYLSSFIPAQESSGFQWRPMRSLPGRSEPFPLPENAEHPDEHIPASVFNQGYYERFFREVGKLGRGYRGAVFQCRHVLLDPLVVVGDYAVKKIPVGDNREWLARMLEEVHTLERTRHPSIIEYKHCWIEDHQMTSFGPSVPCLFILMELANGGNLEDFVMQHHIQSTEGRRRTLSERFHENNRLKSVRSGLSNQQIWSFFLDICSGLNHLHQHGILHRDLKPSNLLLKFEDAVPRNKETIPHVLISDFGECEVLFDHREKLQKRTGNTGTIEFTAPEMLRKDCTGNFVSEFTPAADLWSLGMILYYLCFGQLPYLHVDDVSALRKEILGFRFASFKLQLDTEVMDDLAPEFISLIRRLLSSNPRERPSAAQILQLVNQNFSTKISRGLGFHYSESFQSSNLRQRNRREYLTAQSTRSRTQSPPKLAPLAITDSEIDHHLPSTLPASIPSTRKRNRYIVPRLLKLVALGLWSRQPLVGTILTGLLYIADEYFSDQIPLMSWYTLLVQLIFLSLFR